MGKVMSISGKLPQSWKNWRAIVGAVKLLEHRFNLRRKRKELQQKVEALEREEHEIDEHFISQLTPQEITGIKCRYGSVSIQEKEVPKVVDKIAFVKWMAKNGAEDCAWARANEEACQLRWEEGKKIDGVEKLHHKRVSLHEGKE